jgi:predicted RNase H-like HicB family nuclease
VKNNIGKYTFRIEWSEEDNVHIARCLEFPSLSAHGAGVLDALREIESVVEETIAWLKEEGAPIPTPFGLKKFRGHLTLRVPTEKHRELVIRSTEEGVSVNQFILSRL